MLKISVPRLVCVALVAVLAFASPALAQLSRIGINPNPYLGANPVRGTDVSYDPVNNIYLVVGSTSGNTFYPLYGVFTNTSGDPLTAPFQINVAGNQALFPRVMYSRDANNGQGGFLVTWSGGVWSLTVKTRIVAYPAGVISSEYDISGAAPFSESGAAIAYSQASHNFLVAWRSADANIWAATVNVGGQPSAGARISAAGSGIGSRDPSVAWNSASNVFGVLYSGWGPSGATNTFSLVDTAGTLLTRNTFNTVGVGTYVTDLSYNPATGRFVGVWSQSDFSASNSGTFGAEFDASGNVVTQGLLSTTTGTYDGLTISYNPMSGTFLLAGQGPSYNVWGAELNSRGARTSGDGEVTSAGASGSFYPRASANLATPQWDISFMHNGNMHDQVVATSTTGGGPAGTLAAPPTTSTPTTTPTTTTSSCPGTAPFPGAVCVNGGWVPGDTTTSSGSTSTGGCPGTAPFPGAVCVNGGWVPGGTTSSGSTSTGGCPGTAPFPGAICVNGGWIPGGSTTSTGGCPGTAPFPGAICVNGGWIPGGSTTSTGGCPGTAPFPGAICVNGGWIPGSTSTSSSSCSTPDPFASMGGGTCINGGWTFGSTSTSSSGGCTTPDPFTAMGGGVCINGGWIPK